MIPLLLFLLLGSPYNLDAVNNGFTKKITFRKRKIFKNRSGLLNKKKKNVNIQEQIHNRLVSISPEKNRSKLDYIFKEYPGIAIDIYESSVLHKIEDRLNTILALYYTQKLGNGSFMFFNDDNNISLYSNLFEIISKSKNIKNPHNVALRLSILFSTYDYDSSIKTIEQLAKNIDRSSDYKYKLLHKFKQYLHTHKIHIKSDNFEKFENKLTNSKLVKNILKLNRVELNVLSKFPNMLEILQYDEVDFKRLINEYENYIDYIILISTILDQNRFEKFTKLVLTDEYYKKFFKTTEIPGYLLAEKFGIKLFRKYLETLNFKPSNESKFEIIYHMFDAWNEYYTHRNKELWEEIKKDDRLPRYINEITSSPICIDEEHKLPLYYLLIVDRTIPGLLCVTKDMGVRLIKKTISIKKTMDKIILGCIGVSRLILEN
jgi:hypothetical protein